MNRELLENYIRNEVRQILREAKPVKIAAKKFPKVNLTIKPNELTITQVDNDTSHSIRMTAGQFDLMIQKYQAAMK